MNKHNYFPFFKIVILATMSILAIAIIILPKFSNIMLTNWLELLLFYGPRWLLLIPIPLLLLTLYKSKLVTKVLIFSCSTIIIWFQDIQLNLSQSTSNEDKFRIFSLNTGGGVDIDKLRLQVESTNPDIVILQESNKNLLKQVFNNEWYTTCSGQLCLASKYNFENKIKFDRKQINSWGYYAAHYEVNIHNNTLNVLNVHLETPRNIISKALAGKIAWKDINILKYRHKTEALMVNIWASNQTNFLMAGDFNMPINYSTYQQYFGKYNNAINEVGQGFNYTKSTKWYAMRIDHQLFSPKIKVLSSHVLPSAGGDHRAIISEYAFSNTGKD